MINCTGINNPVPAIGADRLAVYKMDSYVLVLALIIGLCAVAIIVTMVKLVAPKKSKDSTKGGYSSRPVPPPGPVPGTAPGTAPGAAPAPKPASRPAPVEPVKQGPPQVNVYVYRPAGSMKHCPQCDGENESYATQCQICGQPLR